jgi:hypothetical protein
MGHVGQKACALGERGKMMLVPVSAADERRMREILRTLVLPEWIARCGETCRSVWNETLGAKLDMPIP